MWYKYVTHITVKKNRRVVYLVLRAAFSCWSRFLIILHCLAVCLAVPLHQDSTIHVCNSVVRHWKKITLTKIKLTNCNFFKVRTCIRHPWQWKKNKKTFLFNNLFISIFKTVHILLRESQHSTQDTWKTLGLNNDICNSISLLRVCTDFWIQNSRFFPDFSACVAIMSCNWGSLML